MQWGLSYSVDLEVRDGSSEDHHAHAHEHGDGAYDHGHDNDAYMDDFYPWDHDEMDHLLYAQYAYGYSEDHDEDHEDNNVAEDNNKGAIEKTSTSSVQRTIVDNGFICTCTCTPLQPTSVPTAEPTAEPTSEPTGQPTAQPTTGDQPTGGLRVPTSVPTQQPFYCPPDSREYGIRPSSFPTSEPTLSTDDDDSDDPPKDNDDPPKDNDDPPKVYDGPVPKPKGKGKGHHHHTTPKGKPKAKPPTAKVASRFWRWMGV